MRYKVVLVVGIQLLGATIASRCGWLLWFLLTYWVSGTLNQTLTLAMHELSHNLGFKGAMMNRVFGMLANTPLAIPSFM
jgi:sphingolipid delta-4 desaturase